MLATLLSLAAAAVAVVEASTSHHSKRVQCPGNNQIASNAACCVWFDVREELLNDVFFNVCQDNVHGNVRLAFHDASGFSQALKDAGQFPGGGSDGSIIAFQNTELFSVAVDGTQPNADLLGPVQLSQDVAMHHGVSFGDVIQFGAALGLTLCPGGPVVPFKTGRANATGPAPNNLVPLPDQDVTTLLARMLDLGNPGFSPSEVVTLLGSHTAAGQNLVDPQFNGSPFDSTPFIWDTQVFLEVLLANNPGAPAAPGGVLQNTQVMRLNSDAVIARDNRTACAWQSFVAGHDLLVDKFNRQMFRISVVGQDEASLIDCSEVIPAKAAPLDTPTAFFPPNTTIADIDLSCADTPFPSNLPSVGGPVTTVAAITGQNTPNEPTPSPPPTPSASA